MAFTKIQPQQLQLPTFTSPSGDFSFTDLSTGVQINLDRTITGPMIITELRTSAERTILDVADNNSFSEGSICIAGLNNVVSGDNNVLLNGRSTTEFSGSFNTLVNGESVNFGASGQKNTILGGNGVSFGDQVTGSVILADHETAITNSTNHSLVVSFGSGVTFQNGDVQFNGDMQFNGDHANFSSHLSVDSSHSGVFNGNTRFEGISTFIEDVTFYDPVVFTDSVTLSDSSEAASRDWVGLSVTESVDNTLTTALEGADYSTINATILENVLTGTAAGADIFTGHVLTGASNAYFVLQGANFTGALEFANGQYRAI
jgi:hypothetical protein